MKIQDIRTTAKLHNGVEMPVLGLGTYRIEDVEPARRVVCQAVEAGYRHFDTAMIYHNERGVGEGVRSCGIPREELFVTTKLWNEDMRRGRFEEAFEESLAKLGLDYVDLYLIHWPVKGCYVPAWKALEAIYASGRARAIGVSNFQTHHLEEVLQDAQVKPMVNQIEFHPWLAQHEVRSFCAAHDIVVEAWSPLMQGRLTDEPKLLELAAEHNRTPAQIVLRWNLQHGVVTIPKSVTPERIVSNAAIFDFELSSADMGTINALNRDHRLGPDPDDFNF